MGKYKMHKYELGEVVNDSLRIEKQIWVEGKQRKLRGYIVQSIIYLKAETYMILETDLMRGVGCAYKAGRRVCEENSLWSVKNIRENIIDIEEAKNITSHSHKKMTFKCLYKKCNNTKNMKVQTLSTQGYTCPNCSSGISYAERFGLAINQYFNLGFEYQQQYRDGRFDFINYDTKVVIEMNGRQHYKDSSWEGAYRDTKISDDKKRKWCKENGYALIFIDARKSDFEFIKNNINKCEYLPNILLKDKEHILELIEKNSFYDVENIIKLYKVDGLTLDKIGDKHGLTRGVIKSILDRNGIKYHDRRFKNAIKCIETNTEYKNMTEAMSKTGIDRRNIGQCLSGRTKTAGGYHWEFLTE